MRGLGRRSRILVLFPVGCMVLAATSSQAGSRPSWQAELWPEVRMQDPESGQAVQQALRGAARRLGDERCQQLLSDFHDQRGRPLRTRLAETGETAASYLGRIRFREGWSTGECSGNDRLAFTTPGGGVIWVCGGKFEHALSTNKSWAEATIIHEALHTLGLGEGPSASSSLAITRRVLERCGR